MANTLAETYNTGTVGDTNPSTGSTNFASYASILNNLETQLSDTDALGDATLGAGLELALNDLVAYLDTTRADADPNNDAQVYVKSDSTYFGKKWYYLLEFTDFHDLPAELQSLLDAVYATRNHLSGADSITLDTSNTGSFRDIVILLALHSQADGAYIPSVDELTLTTGANSVSVRDGTTIIEIDTTQANDTTSPIKDARLKSQEEDTSETDGKYFHANDFGLYYVNAKEKVNLIYPAAFDKENREEHNLIMVLIKEDGSEQEINFTVLVRDRTVPIIVTDNIASTLYANERHTIDTNVLNTILDSNAADTNAAPAQVTYDEPVDVTVHDANGESLEVEVVTSDNKTFTLKIRRTQVSLAGRKIEGLYLKAVDRDTHYNLASYTNRFDLVFENMTGNVLPTATDITHSEIRDNYQVSNINVLTVEQDSNEDNYSIALDSVTGPDGDTTELTDFFTDNGLKIDLNLTDSNKTRNQFLALRGTYAITVTVTEAHDTNSSDTNLPHTKTVTENITITDDLAIFITQDTNFDTNGSVPTYVVGGTFADTTTSGAQLFTIPAVVFDAYGDAASVSVKADQDGEYVQATLDSNGVIAIATKAELKKHHLKDTYTFTLLIDDDSNNGDTNGATELQVQFSTYDNSAPEIESLVSTLGSLTNGGSTNINPVPMVLTLKNGEKMSDMNPINIEFSVAGGSSGNGTYVTTGDNTNFLISLLQSDNGKVVTVTASVEKTVDGTTLQSAPVTFSYTYDISIDSSFAFKKSSDKVITIDDRLDYSPLEVTDFVVNNNSIDTTEYTFEKSGFSDDYGSNVTSEKHYTFYTFTDGAGNVAALVQEILVNNFGDAANMATLTGPLAATIGSLSDEVAVSLPPGNSYALSTDTNLTNLTNDNSLFTLDTNGLTLNAIDTNVSSGDTYSLSIVATNDASKNTLTSTLTVTVKTSGTPTLTITNEVSSLNSAIDTNTPVKIADVSASFNDLVSGNAIALDAIAIDSVVGEYRDDHENEQFPVVDSNDSNKPLSNLFSIDTNGLYQEADLDDAVEKVTITLKVAATLDPNVNATANIVFTVNDTTTPVLKFKNEPTANSAMLSYTKSDHENAVATFTHGSTLDMDDLLDVSETLGTATTGITTSIALSGDNTALSAPQTLTELTSTLGTFDVKHTRQDEAGNTSNEVTLTITIVQPATIDLVDLNAEHRLTTTLDVDGLYTAPQQLALPEVRLDMKASAFNELFTVDLAEDGINKVDKLLAERIYVQEEMTFGVNAQGKLPDIKHEDGGATIAERDIVQGHINDDDKKFLVPNPEGPSVDKFATHSYANLATFTYVMELMKGVEGLEEATNYPDLRNEILTYFANDTSDTNDGYKEDIIAILDDSNNPTKNSSGDDRTNFGREVFFQILKAELGAGGNGPRLTKKGIFKTAMAGTDKKYAINFQEGDTLTFTVKLKDANGEHQYGQDTNDNTSEDGKTDDLEAANRQVLVKINMKK